MNTLFPPNFSSSMMTLAHECRFKWFRRYVQHLSNNTISSDLHAGGLFASACEITRKAFYNEGMPEAEAIALGKDFILNAANIADAVKTNERVALAFEKYFYYYSNSEVKPASLVDGTHAIEYKFEIDTGIPHPDLPDRNVMFTGRLDLVGTSNIGAREEFFVVDEKTTKAIFRLPGTKIPDIQKVKTEYACRGQFIGYVFACRKLGLPVTKTIVRKVPILTTYEQPFEFSVECNEAMLKWWEQSTFGTIEELVERYKWFKETGGDPRRVFTPVYGDACHSWGSPCNYHQGCTLAEGEEILKMTMAQNVGYPLVETPVPLSEFLATLRG